MGRYAVAFLVVAVIAMGARADDWPQWLGPQRDGVWRETGIVKKFPSGGPKVLWRTPIGGGYAGPAVANGKVYVTDRQLAQGARNPDSPFARGPVQGMERVLCLNETDGKEVWKHEYPCQYRISYAFGPRCTPIVHQGKVYTLGAMGDLFCLDANNGKVIWEKHFATADKIAPPIWGWSANPLLDGDKLICIVGRDGNTAMAFHKDTGKELWRALSVTEKVTAEPPSMGYAPPMIFEIGGKRQLIIWHPESVNSLDPETGKVYWSEQFRAQNGQPLQAGMSIASPRLADDHLLVSCFYNGSMMLKLDRDKPAASVLWRGTSDKEFSKQTDKLHAVMATPFVKDGHIYGVCSFGQMRCLELDTGKRVWETFQPTSGKEARWGHAFIVAHEDRFFLFNEKGDLVIANMTPQGYEEVDRAHLLEATTPAMTRDVVWSHPAFANKHLYARNDKEIICVDLAAEK